MHRLGIIALVALGLVAAACGGGDGESTGLTEQVTSSSATVASTDQETTTTTEAPATTTTATTAESTPPPSEPAVELPETNVSATLGQDATQYYNSDPTKEFDAADLGFEAGTVVAKWYAVEGHWVVAFEGLNLDDTGPLCPGASIFGDDGFVFVSNAPSSGADCSSFPTLSSDPQVRALECNGLLSYRTAIPSDAVGNFLFGTIEKPTAEGFVIGMTSLSLADPTAPGIDIETLSC